MAKAKKRGRSVILTEQVPFMPNFIAKHDFNIGGPHTSDLVKPKYRKPKHKRDFREY